MLIYTSIECQTGSILDGVTLSAAVEVVIHSFMLDVLHSMTNNVTITYLGKNV